MLIYLPKNYNSKFFNLKKLCHSVSLSLCHLFQIANLNSIYNHNL